MTPVKTVFFILCLLTAGLCTAQTQGQMGSDASSQYMAADSTLNHVYHQVLVMYARDSTFIENLKATERMWVQFRNAELKLKFPDAGTQGSVEPMCISLYLSDLTNDRIKTLRVWLNGAEEGDVCAGSIKIKKK